MFAPQHPFQPDLTILFEDREIPARSGDSVATTLLRAGVTTFRTTPVSGAPRLPFCMIGHCFDCLVVIDGIPWQQACLRQVAEGMQVSLQHGPGDLPV